LFLSFPSTAGAGWPWRGYLQLTIVIRVFLHEFVDVALTLITDSPFAARKTVTYDAKFVAVVHYALPA
jgi:hypothetical protein